MGKYLLHSLKYFVKLLVLLVAIYCLMYLTGTLGNSKEELMGDRGVMLLAAIAVLALAYPSFGFVRRKVGVDFTADRDAVRKAFVENGYALAAEEPDRLVFRASSIGKRLWSFWDDRMTVTPATEGRIVIEGIRKEVVLVIFRIESYTKYR